MRGVRLGLARIALGAILLVRTTALSNLLPIPLAHVRGPLYGWPEPGFSFAWGGLVLPDSVRIGVLLIRTAAALCFLLGVRARVAGLVAAACGFLSLSQDPFGFIFTLHTLFLGTAMLALGDATSELALVPERALGREASARLVRIFVASIYAWSALAKLHREWLSGDTLAALAADSLLSPRFAGLLLGHPQLRVVAALGVFLSELALGPLLLWKRTRRAAFFAALLMHLTFDLAARPDVMGFVMAALLLAAAFD